MSATQPHDSHEPKPPKYVPVQNWENEGGAVPEQVLFDRGPSSKWKALPLRFQEVRRNIARVVTQNPELSIALAVGVGFVIGSRARAYPVLKAVVGMIATSQLNRMLASVEPGAADTI